MASILAHVLSAVGHQYVCPCLSACARAFVDPSAHGFGDRRLVGALSLVPASCGLRTCFIVRVGAPASLSCPYLFRFSACALGSLDRACASALLSRPPDSVSVLGACLRSYAAAVPPSIRFACRPDLKGAHFIAPSQGLVSFSPVFVPLCACARPRPAQRMCTPRLRGAHFIEPALIRIIVPTHMHAPVPIPHGGPMARLTRCTFHCVRFHPGPHSDLARLLPDPHARCPGLFRCACIDQGPRYGLRSFCAPVFANALGNNDASADLTPSTWRQDTH
ncbi:hypothetical protein B0H19DRAFT_1255801 [Mycena capillaripes]|nr:hypothetical protein B0H19DRAFT_1255801 [Mycena capillaripes]